ncbi:MAG TPA: hypothetical protein VH879_00725 [Gemmatimonadales bacterium]|jgi:hypothetical protein
MVCQRCNVQQAVEQDGHPAPCHLFGEIDGYFCPDCIVALQQPFEAALRRDIAERAPDLTAADLAQVPDQMLKFTLCLPIPRKDS